MKKSLLLGCLTLLLAQTLYAKKPEPAAYNANMVGDPIAAFKNNLGENTRAAKAFSCVNEVRPELSAETQQLYDYAYYHDLHNIWSDEPSILPTLARYYRIAAANGDYKANLRLQFLLSSGLLRHKKKDEEVNALNTLLQQSLPATAAYQRYLHIAAGIFPVDQEQAYIALRKAVVLGSPQAQSTLSGIIMDSQNNSKDEFRKQLSNRLLQCASQGGHANSSEALASNLSYKKDYRAALVTSQLGAKQGNFYGIMRLREAFKLNRDASGQASYDYLDVEQDLERSRRYALIFDFLVELDRLDAQVFDLDEIVPLPPATLPAWDGKTSFQRWLEGPSPVQPSDELMQKLAEAKGLDPQTGFALKP